MENLKQQLYKLCFEKIDESISSVQQSIDEARAAQQDETKSSAGDKFETTREMMTQEIEKGSALLAKLNEEKNLLTAMMQGETHGTVQPGSVVITNQGKFLVGVSIGAVTLAGEKFQSISPSSPIGQLMLDKKTGEAFSLHDREYIIEEIL